MASPTHPKMDTARLNPLWRRFQDLHQLRTCEAALFLHQTDTDAFPWQPKRDENRPTIFQSSHGVTTIGEGCQSDIVFHKMIGRPVGSPILIRFHIV
jgi:hypothetical protein